MDPSLNLPSAANQQSSTNTHDPPSISRTRTPLPLRLASLVSGSNSPLQPSTPVSERPPTPGIEAATLQDWMKRLFAANAARAPTLSGAAASTSTSLRTSEDGPIIADIFRRDSFERGPTVISQSPMASEELEEALSDEMFPPLPRLSQNDIPRPQTAHLHSHHHPPLSPQSPNGNGYFPISHATDPISSLSLQPLPEVHLSSTSSSSHSDLKRSSSLFSRTSMLGGRGARKDSSVDTLRALHSSATPSGWWRADKKNVDPLLKEEERGETQAEGEEIIQRKYRTPKYPLVFCHGLLGFDSIALGGSYVPSLTVTHWRGITDVLRTNGAEVLITRVPATSGIRERARVLKEKVEAELKGRRVHLIGHSMGGLDCRYLVSKLKPNVKVMSVTTIATPHRGSSFADYFIHELIGRDRLPSVVSLLDTLLPNANGDGSAFEELTLESMRHFNENTPDVPGVKYYSWGATYEPGLVDSFRWPHSIILPKEGPNDGLVSVESAKWGEYLGTVENVNHLDLIGWMNVARYRWHAFLGSEIKYKPATFYLEVADRLAGQEEEMERNREEEGHKEGGIHAKEGSGEDGDGVMKDGGVD